MLYTVTVLEFAPGRVDRREGRWEGVKIDLSEPVYEYQYRGSDILDRGPNPS